MGTQIRDSLTHTHADTHHTRAQFKIKEGGTAIVPPLWFFIFILVTELMCVQGGCEGDRVISSF